MKDVSRETRDALDYFASELRRWARRINLVAPSTLQSLETRHIEDSVQILDHAGEWTSWCDIGAGGGLPGLVVAIVRPDRRVTLIESDQRKGVFLRHIIRSLGLNASVISTRIESAPPQSADIVSARALAGLRDLIPLGCRHGHPETRYIFPKGARYGDEIAKARMAYRFDVDVRPSITDKEAVILVLENIDRV